MKNEFNKKTFFFVLILIMLLPHLLKPYSVNILFFIVLGSVFSIILISWSTAIRNFKKGTFSLNPITQAKALRESNLSQFEMFILKYCLTIILSAILSFTLYSMIKV